MHPYATKAISTQDIHAMIDLWERVLLDNSTALIENICREHLILHEHVSGGRGKRDIKNQHAKKVEILCVPKKGRLHVLWWRLLERRLFLA